MDEAEIRKLVLQANEFMKRNDTARAAELLKQVLRADPRNTDAWFLFAGTVTDPAKQRQILERVLQIDPFHAKARDGLEWLNTTGGFGTPAGNRPATSPPPKAAPQQAAPAAPEVVAIRRSQLPWLIVGGLALVLVAVIVGVLLGRASTPQAVVMVITPTANQLPTRDEGSLLPPTWTPRPSRTPLPTQADSGNPPTWTPLPEVVRPTVAVTATLTPTLMLTLTPTLTPTPDFEVVLPYLFEAFPVAVTYARQLDRIVYVSEGPNQLHLVNPADGSEATISLPRAPLSLSVSGAVAAVGHDALVSYVDLQAGTVEDTFEVDSKVENILISPLGWIYTNNRAINIKSGDTLAFLGSYYYGNEPMRLHPGNKRIYGATQGLSPADIYRVDLQADGAPVKEGRYRDSPYHGDYGMCDRLWLSEDGKRIVTGCGNIFRSMDNADQDMTYNGSLSQSRLVADAAQLSEADRLVVINGIDSWEDRQKKQPSIVVVYEYSSLNPVETYITPHVEVNGRTFEARAQQVFPAPDPNEYYLVVKVDESAGLLNNLGLIKRSLAGATVP